MGSLIVVFAAFFAGFFFMPDSLPDDTAGRKQLSQLSNRNCTISEDPCLFDCGSIRARVQETGTIPVVRSAPSISAMGNAADVDFDPALTLGLPPQLAGGTIAVFHAGQI